MVIEGEVEVEVEVAEVDCQPRHWKTWRISFTSGVNYLSLPSNIRTKDLKASAKSGIFRLCTSQMSPRAYGESDSVRKAAVKIHG